MSLTDIHAMRTARQKPSGVVSVVVGRIPKIHCEDRLTVEIAPGSNPSLMDWRPLLGVWVAVIHVDGDWRLVDQTVEAVAKAGAKLFGFAKGGLGYPLAEFFDENDKRRAAALLVHEWEAMCS